MSNEKRIYKPKSIAGFPEWLPEERLVEQKWFDHIRRVFESYGFCNIETPSVEELDVLTAKGEVDKEIYVIERLHKDENDKKEARLALHFDQTVPMARYVAMNFNELVFPFKRYQMQRVWRGERPQMGRMREFYQCDIDIINVDSLPITFDAEVASVMYEVLEGLPVAKGKGLGRVQIKISNRKILIGMLEANGVFSTDDQIEVFRLIDKKEKFDWTTKNGKLEYPFYEELGKLLNRLIASPEKADQLRGVIDIIVDDEIFNDKSRSEQIRLLTTTIPNICDGNITFEKGIEELVTVLENLSHLPEHAVVANLGIVRGLDYYTGTVYETQLLDLPEFTGSVCSGGRYDDLAGSYINKHLPGVGISIGFSRLFDVIRQTRPGLLGIGAKGPAHVMMTVPENEADRAAAYEAARTLRKNGVNVEMYHAPKKIGDQLKYASKKNLPFVWFVRDGKHEVKDMINQSQAEADPKTWKANT